MDAIPITPTSPPTFTPTTTHYLELKEGAQLVTNGAFHIPLSDQQNYIHNYKSCYKPIKSSLLIFHLQLSSFCYAKRLVQTSLGGLTYFKRYYNQISISTTTYKRCFRYFTWGFGLFDTMFNLRLPSGWRRGTISI